MEQGGLTTNPANTMKITTLPNGNLSIQAGNPLEQRAIARMRDKQTALSEARFVKRFLRHYGFKTIKPEDCGALTSATLIRKGDNVWAFMSYQVESFLETLARGGETIWQKG
jgi:hypothetical protein